MVYAVVFGLIFVALIFMIWKSRRRKTDGYVPMSRTQDYWSRFKATLSGSKDEEEATEPELFYRGRSVQFPSQWNGNGPLVWGTVMKAKKFGDITLHADGTPNWLKVKRKRSVMMRINFPSIACAELKPVPMAPKTDHVELASELNELEDRLTLAVGAETK